MFNISTTADLMKLEKIIKQFEAVFDPRKNIFLVQVFYLPSGNRTVF